MGGGGERGSRETARKGGETERVRANADLAREDDGATGRSRGSAGSSSPPSARGSPGRRRGAGGRRSPSGERRCDGAQQGQRRQLIATLSAGEPQPTARRGAEGAVPAARRHSQRGGAPAGTESAQGKRARVSGQLLQTKFHTGECEPRPAQCRHTAEGRARPAVG